MRLRVKFNFDRLNLPIHYNHILHATILNMINNEEFRKFIHDRGYKFEKRVFKLYTFSRLIGRFEIDTEIKEINFFDNVYLYISSYDDNFCYYIMEKLLTFENIRMGKNILKVEKIETINFMPTDTLKVVTRSPVTVYSTYIDETGKKKTLFYHPDDFKFKEIVEKNIIKKYRALHNREPQGRIEVKHVGKSPKFVLVFYKGFKIKGWMTAFDLIGDPELVKIAYETGLGSKNSQGFGFIEQIK
ncbi:hypothetical protein SU69_08495 [Thermosipho melanesiensis]|uniref:CRISPR-associated endoribonuclease n=2 Tax=Thermosipho melanesiensis TaxID=46541 RepID=A6LNL8_THEM4|nr:CRISPR-associated endoribonuclease Cas6 [Thermosipho melanesiensis]ABR31519.1 CRISPR-associated protein Cas6 [Thermosipho melanesiensis BI429]APT74565.1 CRISPR-associated protein [Thermosipho melanesiensis]OOC35266.1 hypothetical protein SU69_08495 [Thermosipho melanesiensis]OOC35485.1 hypothetical protein SU70_08505 [Thermosipho melanesiensis]OOC36521.1 hypothetical protein SU68_08560 [Thermosipho melanesiensis]